MKNIYLVLAISFLTCNTVFAQVTISGGSPAINGNYTTLTTAGTGAFAAINAGGSQAGYDILITINADIVEPVTAGLLGGDWASLTINPAGGAPRLVSANYNGALINLAGVENVTIDGLNTGGNALTISNTSGTASAITIRFANDASDNMIVRCTLLGSSGALTAASGLATIYFSSGITTGNNYNTITECNIAASATGPARHAIQSASIAAAPNINNTIFGNNISDFFHPGIFSGGISLGNFNSNWNISNNRFYQTATRITTAVAGVTHTGILISSGSNYTITDNIIGFANPAGTGTTNMTGITSGALGGTFPGAFTTGTAVPNATRYNAIQCAFTAGGAVSSIQNNTIAGIALLTSSNATGGTGILCGIAVTSGNANIGTVTGNTIGSAIGTSSIYVASTAGIGNVSGFYCISTNSINIQNNTIGGIDVSGTTNTTATAFKGIEIGGTGTYSIINNSVGNATPNNIRTGYLLTGVNLSNTATTPTAASGISNVRPIICSVNSTSLDINNNIIQGIQVSGTQTFFTAINNLGTISTIININNNQVGTASTGAINFIAATSGGITLINNSMSTGTAIINISGNSMQGISCVSSGNFMAINNNGGAGSAIDISNNQLGTASGDLITYSAATANGIYGIFTAGGTAAAGTLTIQNNSIRGIVHAVAATASHFYIYNFALGLSSVNIAGNTFINLDVNTSGNITFITDAGGLTATGTSSCSNNAIITGFNKTGASGNLIGYQSGINNVNGSSMTETGNNFSNITMTGTGSAILWQNNSGVSSVNAPNRNISGNSFSNISVGSGALVVMSINAGAATDCSSNTISNISGTGSITAMDIGLVNGQGTHNYSSNTILSLVSNGTGGDVTGIRFSCPSVFTANINGNSITGLSSTGDNAVVAGINLVSGGTETAIFDNLVNDLSGSGTGVPALYGIRVIDGLLVNVYRNKLHSFTESAAISAGSSAVHGIFIDGGTTVNAYNNFIAQLNTPNASLANGIMGIAIISSTVSTNYNLYHNSIYINAGSTGANFGNSGVYHVSNAVATTGALNMTNNIIVNTSTPNGTGLTAAYRRADPTLTNYGSASDYNLFYAGTPSANRLIFYDGTNSDQTMSAYKTRVSTRDANSISDLPNFVSATDLHLTANNCRINGRGTPLGTVTDDIDLDFRHPTTPDIGADEFTAVGSIILAGVAGTAVCDDRAVDIAGTTYVTNVCDLIARVIPSGGDPVTGNINVCVTLDAAQLYFNGEPYVQRHFDLEPVTGNQTSTSATVTFIFYRCGICIVQY
ncbi:MAG: hypothetical protein IPI54_17230 [Chitinophagaceae bacterium]|nr:hypothetical protein [Chitinophagaceae bacterium]